MLTIVPKYNPAVHGYNPAVGIVSHRFAMPAARMPVAVTKAADIRSIERGRARDMRRRRPCRWLSHGCFATFMTALADFSRYQCGHKQLEPH